MQFPLNALDIRQFLPHRYPMALVDRVTSIEGDCIWGYKNVSLNEEYMQGHFVENPILPGVMIVEAMAQLAGILAFATIAARPVDGIMFMLAGAEHVRFKRQIVPGDRLDMTASLVQQKQHIFIYDCVGKVDGAVAATAQVMLAKHSIKVI